MISLCFRLAETSKILYSMSILVGWLLQFYVPMQIIQPWLSRHRRRWLLEIASRIFFTLLTCEILHQHCFTEMSATGLNNDYLYEFARSWLKLDILCLEQTKNRKSKHVSWADAIGRLLTLFSGACAVAIPDLGDYITLIGAFSSSFLALIFPPIIHIFTFYVPHDDERESLLTGEFQKQTKT